jgi:hypothetical protein
MGTIVAGDIIENVRITLVDPDGVRWTDEELLGWLNDAQREIAILRPDSSVSVESIQLEANVTLQELPDHAQGLVKLTRNMGANGATPGIPVRLVDHDELDRVKPTWHTSTAGAAVKNYTYDGKSPKVFYVYPRPSAAIYVEAHMRVVPEVVEETDAISIDDIYVTAIHDYIVMRSKMKATDVADDAAAEAYYQRFLNRLGLKLRVDKSVDPHAPKSNPPVTTPAPAETRDGASF